MEESLHQGLFNLGARLGSLEGYLYGAASVEKHYLAGWLQNIDREFTGLPAAVAREIATDYAAVLAKVLKLLQRHFGEDDVDTIKVRTMVTGLRGTGR